MFVKWLLVRKDPKKELPERVDIGPGVSQISRNHLLRGGPPFGPGHTRTSIYLARYPKVSDLGYFLIHEDVLWFQVSMNNRRVGFVYVF